MEGMLSDMMSRMHQEMLLMIENDSLEEPCMPLEIKDIVRENSPEKENNHKVDASDVIEEHGYRTDDRCCNNTGGNRQCHMADDKGQCYTAGSNRQCTSESHNQCILNDKICATPKNDHDHPTSQNNATSKTIQHSTLHCNGEICATPETPINDPEDHQTVTQKAHQRCGHERKFSSEMHTLLVCNSLCMNPQIIMKKQRPSLTTIPELGLVKDTETVEPSGPSSPKEELLLDCCNNDVLVNNKNLGKSSDVHTKAKNTGDENLAYSSDGGTKAKNAGDKNLGYSSDIDKNTNDAGNSEPNISAPTSENQDTTEDTEMSVAEIISRTRKLSAFSDDDLPNLDTLKLDKDKSDTTDSRFDNEQATSEQVLSIEDNTILQNVSKDVDRVVTQHTHDSVSKSNAIRTKQSTPELTVTEEDGKTINLQYLDGGSQLRSVPNTKDEGLVRDSEENNGNVEPKVAEKKRKTRRVGICHGRPPSIPAIPHVFSGDSSTNASNTASTTIPFTATQSTTLTVPTGNTTSTALPAANTANLSVPTLGATSTTHGPQRQYRPTPQSSFSANPSMMFHRKSTTSAPNMARRASYGLHHQRRSSAHSFSSSLGSLDFKQLSLDFKQHSQTRSTTHLVHRSTPSLPHLLHHQVFSKRGNLGQGFQRAHFDQGPRRANLDGLKHANFEHWPQCRSVAQGPHRPNFEQRFQRTNLEERLQHSNQEHGNQRANHENGPEHSNLKEEPQRANFDHGCQRANHEHEPSRTNFNEGLVRLNLQQGPGIASLEHKHLHTNLKERPLPPNLEQGSGRTSREHEPSHTNISERPPQPNLEQEPGYTKLDEEPKQNALKSDIRAETDFGIEQHEAAVPQLHVHEPGEEWTEQRTSAINGALAWIKSQLLAMRDEDRDLIQSLLRLDRSIREVKLWRCCETNRQALDDAIDEYTDPARLITDSVPQALCPVLKEIGITKMNIKGRRFSVL